MAGETSNTIGQILGENSLEEPRRVRTNDDGILLFEENGTDATGINQLPGGTGIKGWLSGIYSKLTEILTTKIDQTTDGETNRVVSKISQTVGENVVSFGDTAQPVSISSLSSLENIIIKGIATSGTSSFLIDDTKDFEPDSLNNKLIKIVIDGIDYYRKIVGCIANSIGFTTLPPEFSSFVLVTGSTGGLMVINCVVPGENDYEVILVAGEGAEQTTQVTFADNLLTITSPTDVNSDPEDILPGNVEMIINNTPELAALFAIGDYQAGLPLDILAEPIPFTGGSDAIEVTAGVPYEVIIPVVKTMEIDNEVTNPIPASIIGSLVKSSATITIGTGAAHSAGDVVSTDAGEILEFETGLTAGSGGIILDSLTTLNQNVVFSGGAGYTLYLFNVSPTAQATNAVFNLDSLTGYLGFITIGTLVDRGDNCAISDLAHNKVFTLATGDTKLYGKAVCNGGETTISAKTLTYNLFIVSM